MKTGKEQKDAIDAIQLALVGLSLEFIEILLEHGIIHHTDLETEHVIGLSMSSCPDAVFDALMHEYGNREEEIDDNFDIIMLDGDEEEDGFQLPSFSWATNN